MMGKIQRLEEGLVNLIAAGEVVERPASVAKELVENSLDAGATNLKVRYEQGGMTLLEVDDDGEGMSKEDAVLALERHATSKVRGEADLERIHTLGFRGEALPSIVQVSRTELRTRRRGEQEGTRLVVEGGRLLLREVVGTSPGTRVTVRDLFFNTPARKAYLKPPATESARVLEVLGRLALASPGVQFDVVSDGRPVLQTDGNGDLRGVVASLWGVDAADRTLPILATAAGMRVSGLISRPDLSRSNRQGQVLVVNGRPVQNLRVRYAAEEAYRSLLMKGRYPYLVLVVELAPDAVDPNVHPTKWEVRFRDEAALARLVHEACRESLLPRRASDAGPRRAELALREEPPLDRWHRGEGEGQGLTFFGGASAAAAEAIPPMPYARCQVKSLFIVAEGEGSLFLVDQHAAHERVGYDRLVGRPEERTAQDLLVPLVVTLAPGDREHLRRWEGALTSEGFAFEAFGRSGETVVRRIPAFLVKDASPRILEDILRELGEEPEEGLQAKRHVWMAMAACRAAVKRKDVLSVPEQQALLAALWATAEPRHCPHGRPTWVSVPYGQLEHRFGRS